VVVLLLRHGHILLLLQGPLVVGGEPVARLRGALNVEELLAQQLMLTLLLLIDVSGQVLSENLPRDRGEHWPCNFSFLLILSLVSLLLDLLVAAVVEAPSLLLLRCCLFHGLLQVVVEAMVVLLLI